MTVTDPTAYADPVLRERFALGHHPRRNAADLLPRPAAPSFVGWYRPDPSGLDSSYFYRVSDELVYRVDAEDGLFQVIKLDLRPGHEYLGPFGPPLREWISAKTLVETDAELLKGPRS
ncbi:hypothetical protein SEA_PHRAPPUCCINO_20 [Mycobacterium phage Phrappuccino]|uniref:Uncharacterized protein n=1 Tax=Mycobacterium phage Phrappuccino TaxID=2591223 RepID=A0A514DDL9_9CAUD|nr:hypothetical protein KHQ87_gp020 [Mycobacterium phage Phrappuccino]QDH91698.1 hypothetical protein SEA_PHRAPPUCCINO_20 [Mycobacterium phage Phrappuccino]QIQ63142.1 hypothetical protein SEA_SETTECANDELA_20 [Mycobacterium phage Settecandela]